VPERRLIRYYWRDGEARQTEVHNIDLGGRVAGRSTAYLRLEPFDLLSIKELPAVGRPGERHAASRSALPGSYAIKRGKTLSSVVQGRWFDDLRLVDGAVLYPKTEETRAGATRRSVPTLQRDLAILAAASLWRRHRARVGSSASRWGHPCCRDYAVARRWSVVIDLPHAMHAKPGSETDIVLRGGDRLLVPKPSRNSFHRRSTNRHRTSTGQPDSR